MEQRPSRCFYINDAVLLEVCKEGEEKKRVRRLVTETVHLG